MWVTQANHSQKTSYSIEKIHIFICFSLLFPFYAQERIAPVPLCSVGLFWRGMEAIHSCRYLQKRDLELIAPVTLYKRVTVSDLLLLLFPKKPQDQFTLFQEWSALSLTKNKRFAWKTKKQIPKPEPNCTIQKKFTKNLNFSEHMLVVLSESHISLKCLWYMTFTPPYKPTFFEI